MENRKPTGFEAFVCVISMFMMLVSCGCVLYISVDFILCFIQSFFN